MELNDVGREQAAVVQYRFVFHVGLLALAFLVLMLVILFDFNFLQVADRLSREFKVSAVYSSDLKRASETAEKIAASCGIAEVYH